MADDTTMADLADSAIRDLRSALEANTMLRTRLDQARDETEDITRGLTRAADLRLEVHALERRLVERVEDLSATLTRIGIGLEEIDQSVRRSGYALREAAEHTRHQDAGGRDQPPETETSLRLALDGLVTVAALTAGSRDGVDAAQRAVAHVGEQLRPTPPAHETDRPMRAAREEIAAAARQTTARQAAAETTAHHCMTLAAALPPSTTDPARSLERMPTSSASNQHPHRGPSR